MSETEQAVREFWHALATARLWPPDKWTMGAVAGVGTAVGIYEGLGLWTPLYAALLIGLFGALIWAVDRLAKAKDSE